MVSGNPKRLKTGFTIKFKIPKTMAKIIAVEKPSKCTPGKILVKRKATMAVISSRRIKFIMFDFLMFIGATVQKVFHLSFKRQTKTSSWENIYSNFKFLLKALTLKKRKSHPYRE